MKGHMLRDPMYGKCPQQANPQRQRQSSGCQVLGEGAAGWLLMGTGPPFRVTGVLCNDTEVAAAQHCKRAARP